MGEYPIELEPGKLGCPRCKTQLVDGEAPCYYEGHVIGMYDGMACETCDYALLTQKGFEEAADFIDMLPAVQMVLADMTYEIRMSGKGNQITFSEISQDSLTAKSFKDETSDEHIAAPLIQNFKRPLLTNQ